MITADIHVKKRNGRGTEPLNLDKIHVMVEEACKGLSGVSSSQVEMQSQLSFYDGITTAQPRSSAPAAKPDHTERSNRIQ